ncbi:MAG: hypothetical protein AABY10_04265, partial [Nanoarchaeota archaeon]
MKKGVARLAIVLFVFVALFALIFFVNFGSSEVSSGDFKISVSSMKDVYNIGEDVDLSGVPSSDEGSVAGSGAGLTGPAIQTFPVSKTTLKSGELVSQEILVNEGRLSQAVTALRDLPVMSLDPVEPFDRDGLNKRIEIVKEKGKDVEISGELGVEHSENLDLKRDYEEYYLNLDGERVIVYFSKDQLFQIGNLDLFGSRVILKVSGIGVNFNKDSFVQKEIAVDNFEIVSSSTRHLSRQDGSAIASAGSGYPWDPVTIGEQRIALIIYNLDEDITSQEAARRLQNNLNSFWGGVSYGKLRIKVDGYGPYEGGCDRSTYFRSAMYAANRDIYYPDYNGVFVLTAPGACGTDPGVHTGATPGSYSLNGQNIFLSTVHIGGAYTLSHSVSLHEFGHTLGLGHTLADNLDIMSYSGVRGLNAVSIDQLGWLDDSNVIEINDENKLNYFELAPLEFSTAALKVLKIKTKIFASSAGDLLTYYISYRPTTPGCSSQGGCDGFRININSPVEGVDADPSDVFSSVLRAGQTYYEPDPLKRLLVSAVEENGKLKVTFGSIHCGDGKIDAGEECDGYNLDLGNSCETIGFESGNLKCNAQCKFDTSQCENRVCRQEDERIGERECRGIFTGDIKDNYVYSYEQYNDINNELNQQTWDRLRYTIEKVNIAGGYSPGHFLVLFSNHLYPATQFSPIRRDFMVTRAYFPFNTSSLSNSAVLESGNILFHLSEVGNAVVNSHPNSKDFLTLVPVQLQNSPDLKKSDFLSFGEVDNPVELGNRFDVSQDYNTLSREISFELNEDGKNNVNLKGFSNFGIRFGYDLGSEVPNNGESTQLVFSIKSADPRVNPSYEPPTLNLIYRVPFFSYIKNNGNTYASGNLILKVQKENMGVWEDVEVVYNGNVAIPANDKLALDSYWNNKAWNANTGAGNYRVYVEFEGLSDSREFFVKGEGCGNGNLDAGEVCDGNVLGSFGNGAGKCKQFDSRNVFGDLKCSKSCLEYDSSECVAGTGGECGAGDIKNSDGTCTFSVSSNSSDGTLRLDNTQLKTNWVDFVRNPEASELDTTSNLLSVIMSRASDSYPQNYISRPIVNFDVSKIPQGSRIFRASLKVKTDAQLPAPFSRYVARNYPEDFVSLFRVNLLNSGQISLADFGSFGQEVVDRKDVVRKDVVRLNGLVRSKEIIFNLNKNGLDYLNDNSKVSFGMKSAPEFSNLENLEDYTALNSNIRVYSGNSNNKPRLNITYVPPAPNSLRTCALQGGDICSGSEVCLGNSLISSDSDKCCSSLCTTPQWASCSQCGTGLFNICDRQECGAIGQGCYFASGIISGTCSACAGASCSNYGSDKLSCEINSCGLQNCNWNQQSNICYAGFCGNGAKEGAEQCDGDTVSCNVNGNQGTKMCNSQCSGYGSCILNQRCGDGIKNGNELCDGNDLDGKSCFDFDFDSGDLKCNAQCNDYDFSMCENQQQCVPSPEECDGIDNDCNSFIDEGLGTVSCGTGECRREINACSSGTIQQCVSGTPPQPKEISCSDLKDNDCDGLTDGVDSDCSVQSVCGDSICNGAETCSSCAVDCGQCLNCRLTQAYWADLSGQGISDINENMNVLLKVVGVNCNNRGINFTVYEEDLNGGNHFVTKFNSKYSNGTWLTSLGGSGVDYKTYYFTAVVYDAGNTAISSFSSLSNSMY